MWNIEIENIGGIRTGAADIGSGVSVVQASNFQGKSSFINALQTVLGATGADGIDHPLMEGASEGHVTLTTEDGTYETTLHREGRTVERRGDVLIDDPVDQEVARLFACLGEDNPIRAAVREGDTERLTDLLQQPMGINRLNAEIAALQEERRTHEEELRAAEEAADELETTRKAINTLETELAELREERDELAEEVAESSTNDELADLEDELSEKRGDLNAAERRIKTLEDSIERLEDEKEEIESELASLDIPDEPAVDADLEDKKKQLRETERQVELVRELYSTNKRILEENAVDIVAEIDRDITGDKVACWVCGSETDRDDIQERLDALQAKLQSLQSRKTDLEQEIDNITSQQSEIKQLEQKERRLESKLTKKRRTLEEKKEDLNNVENRRDRLAEEVEELEAAVAEEREGLEESAQELSDELTDIKTEINQKENELEDKRSKQDRLEKQQEGRKELSETIDDLSNEIESLREQKRTRQDELQAQFNEALDDVIERFAPGFDGGHMSIKRENDGSQEIRDIEITIGRNGQQANIQNLSEGERELVGIVVALAGYRAFDVSERVPVILLDGISQLAASNLKRLIDYIGDEADKIVTTAYPEAGDFDGRILSPDEWDVVSDETKSPA